MQTVSSSIYKNLDQFRLFIFDLDGTLYDQAKLRRRIARGLFLRLFTSSIRTIDLKIITSFRRQREDHKGYRSQTLETDQYEWTAQELNVSVDKVNNLIVNVMHKLPLRLLPKARYRNIDKVFNALKDKNKAIAIYSDYPVKEKLNALDLEADGLFCSTDPDIKQLKPSGKAIGEICKHMKTPREQTILIGDRDDTDGESARQAGIFFLKVDVQQARKGLFYANLLQMINSIDD